MGKIGKREMLIRDFRCFQGQLESAAPVPRF